MALTKWTRERFALMTVFEARNVTGAGFTTKHGTSIDADAVLIEKLDQEPFFLCGMGLESRQHREISDLDGR